MCTSIDSLNVETWTSNPTYYLELVNQNLDQIGEIGVTPVELVKEGQLVRLRAMVQDMADPVLYLHRYEVINTKTGTKHLRSGKYRDSLKLEDDEMVDEDSANVEHRERRSVYCVSVPAMNSWIKPPCLEANRSWSSSEDDRISTMAQVKRSAEAMDQDDQCDQTCKRVQKENEQNKEQAEIVLNHPIHHSSNYSCLVNVYEDLDESLIKMNSVVDVIGFVSFRSDCDDFDHLPATLVPRIHAVSLRRITHSNPYLSSSFDQSAIVGKVERIRSDLLNCLTELMLGDSLAAQYLLCNLISRVYHRTEVLSLGHFSVNLTRLTADGYPEEVYNVLSNLLAKSHYLPMTLDNMNSTKFLPEKDYERNCVKSGILQLSDHTHLFIDETKMEAGQLNSNGVQNLKALENLIKDQKIDYDFKYVKIEIPVDVPTIVMSEGKSLLSTSVQVILSPEQRDQSPEQRIRRVREVLLKEPLLTEVRQYLTIVSHADFNLADDLIQTIQQDYVKLRQEERSANESDLHLLLVLSRLISLSYGQSRLSKEMWEKAFEMELFRKERINNREP